MELKVRLISWSVNSTSLFFCAYQQGGGRPWSQSVTFHFHLAAACQVGLAFSATAEETVIQNDRAFYSSAAQAQEPGSNCFSFPEEGSGY